MELNEKEKTAPVKVEGLEKKAGTGSMAKAKQEGFGEKAKGVFEKLKKKKHIEIIVAVILIVIIIIIYFSTFTSSSSNKNKNTGSTTSTAADYCEQMEQKLTTTLSSVKGAGKVSVIINFESSVEMLIAYIESQSSTSNADGSGSEQSSKTPILDGSNMPIVLKYIYPKAKGVLVSAQGADDAKVKVEMISAVCVLLDISANYVYVTTMQ